MQIPLTIHEIEKSLAQSSGSDIRFLIEPSGKKFQLTPLAESSLIYWLLTKWHQDSTVFSLSSKDEQGSIVDLSKATETIFGKVLALLPYGKIEGPSRKVAAQFRAELLKTQNGWPDLALNRSASLICIDALPDGLAPQLYENQDPDSLKSREHFSSLIETMFSTIATHDEIKGKLEEKKEPLTTIIYELFKNTHQHARTWINGEHFPSSCRGLYTKFYPLETIKNYNLQSIENRNQADEYALSYLKRITQPTKNQELIEATGGIIEISIFDTGPGLAQRWLGKEISEISIKEQHESVLKCLNKGQSSNPSPGRGYGLWKVLRELRNLNGFFRIRTNQVHAARDFFRWPEIGMMQSPDLGNVPKEVLYDWDLVFSSSLKTNPSIRGTVISIMLPVTNA